jgi:trigger factor
MKKKLAIMCIMGAAVLSMTACGSKEESSDVEASATTESTTETDQSEESEIEWVSDRDDYVDIEDIDVDQYITLCDYKDLSVSAVKPETDDDSIESYINSYLLSGIEVTDRAVETGDVANIDYVGKKDGEAFDGGTASGYNLTIGSGTFITGFEDGLIGVMPGDTVDLNLTFPEDYSNSDLAGQDVVFTVTVNYIYSTPEYGTLTVEDMKNMGLDFESLEELWEAGKAAVDATNDETYTSNARSAILDKIASESETNEAMPVWLCDEQKQYYLLYLDQLAQAYYGMDFETYVTTYTDETMEDAESEIYEECEEVVKSFLVIEAIARQEGISLARDEVNEQAAEEYSYYGYEDVDDFIQNVGYSTYRMSLLQEMVLDRLMEIVEVTPETETATE